MAREPIKRNTSTNKPRVSKENSFTIEETELDKIREHSYNVADMVNSIIDLNPDIRTIMETITSLVVSPNDMISRNLQVGTKSFVLPTSVRASFLDYTKKYYDDTYKISDRIEPILETSLYTRGAYIELNLPRTVINLMAKANIKENGNGKVFAGTESGIKSIVDKLVSTDTTHVKSKNMVITDATDILTLDINSNKNDISKHHSAFKSIGAGTESGMAFNITAPTFGTDGDKPIVKVVSTEDIIPICSQDDPSVHEGYFYIVNSRLKPIVTGTDYSDLSSDRLDKMFKEVSKNIGLDTNTTPVIDSIENLKNILVQTKLKEYLSKVKNVSDVTVEMSDKLVLAMADNIINNSDIKIFFLPPELVSYYAFNFRRNGTGKSLLEGVAYLASIRGILMFTDVLGAVKSGVPNTEITVKMDKDTVNYKRVLANVTKNVMGLNKHKLPIGVFGVSNMVKWAQNAGITIKPDYVGVPDTDVSWEEKTSNVNSIDSSVFERIDKQIFASIYGSRSMLENKDDSEFATTVRQNKHELNKRIHKLQRKGNSLMTLDMRKKLLLDSTYINGCVDIIKSNIDAITKYQKDKDNGEYAESSINEETVILKIVYDEIVNVYIEFEKPLDETTSVKASDYTDHVDTIDAVIKTLISTDTLPSSITEKIGDNIDEISASMKTTLVLNYMVDNNILPEFTKSFRLNKDGDPDFTLLNDYKVITNSLLLMSDKINSLKPKEEEEGDTEED